MPERKPVIFLESDVIAIKHRFSDATLCEFDVETVKQAVEKAVKDVAYLRGAYLRGAYLRGADLQGADLQGADLQGAYLQGAYLRGAYLRGADLQGADLQGADLRGADLQGADLQGADLQGAYLQGAYLRGASIDGEEITKQPLSINGLWYWCFITEGFMRLGFNRFTHGEWVNFTDDEISDMDSGALEFWKQWKAPLLAMCAAHKPVVEEVTA